LLAGSFTDEADEQALPSWKSGLRFTSEGPTTVTPYSEYLNRRTAGLLALKKSTTPNVPLVATLPEGSAVAFLKRIIASDNAYAAISLFEVAPRVFAKHRQPLQKMPARGALAFELRMQRRASLSDPHDYEKLYDVNNKLVSQVYAFGGKVYPPFAPILSKEQWRNHYGSELWPRFAAAKQRFDPNAILTPGPGIF
jgi:hypothetical protein